MARRADHTREELHDLIVAAALKLITDGGLQALSARAIAKAIGYTPGTLYQHFKDINEIILHVNATTMQGLIDRMSEAAVTGPDDPRALIHTYADIYVDYVSQHRNAWDAMFSFRRDPGEEVPDWYQAHIRTLIARVEDCFERLGPSRDPQQAAHASAMIWASVHSVCTLDSAGRLHLIIGRDLKTMIHELVDVHITAYLHRGSP